MVKAEDLCKHYKVGVHEVNVLRGISLEVKKGEFLAIRGPSGAGKSTLLHILGGLEKPDKGRVYLEGENIYGFDDTKISEIRNRNIGFIFQFYHLIPELTLRENVALPLLIKGWRSKDAFREAEDRLSYLQLGGRQNHYPNQVSGGEQQRAAIARAIITNPKVLLADEPTGNLDSQRGEEVLKLIKKINSEKNMTVILVTHNSEIASWAERKLYIRDGRLMDKEDEYEDLP